MALVTLMELKNQKEKAKPIEQPKPKSEKPKEQ